jgi:hypothetical protein
MRAIGIDFRDKIKFPFVVDIWETSWFAKMTLRGDKAWKRGSGLISLLEAFSIPYTYASLHNGENDSNFALKAFLAILVQNLRDPCFNSTQRGRLDAVQSIAQASIEMEISKLALERRKSTLENWKPTCYLRTI